MILERTSGGHARPSLIERFYRVYDVTGFLPILLVAMVIFLALFAPHFLAIQNIINVLRASSLLIIASAGQMLVLIVGGFDLSA